MSNNPPNLEAIRWLCGELYLNYRVSREVECIASFLESVDQIQQETIVRYLFWRAMADRDVVLGAWLLERGVMIAPKEAYVAGPIHTAIDTLGECPDIVKWLSDQGAEIDRRDPNCGNATPLMKAIGKGQLRVATVLIEMGADVDATTLVDDDDSALIIAVGRSDIAGTRLLLDSGARQDHVNRWGHRAIDIARKNASSEILKILSSGR